VVLAFAEAMEERLAANDHKGGWFREDPEWLMDRLYEEVRELASEIHERSHRKPDLVKIRREAADVSNFALMVADRLGAIPILTKPPRPTVVTLCGSVRFPDRWAKAVEEETMAGRIVLSVGSFDHARFHSPEGAALKAQMDELHKRKIDLADEILVVTDHVGESTRSEIKYAKAKGKRIRWLEPPKEGA